MFYGANRTGAKVSQGVLDQFWLWSMQGGLKNSYDCIKAFSETDFTEDLKKFDVPTLVMHGEDDQIVPINDSSKKSAKLIKGENYYPEDPVSGYHRMVNMIAEISESVQQPAGSRRCARRLRVADLPGKK